MNLKTFQAASMSEALAQVKTTMGSDAIILHTRTISRHRWLGLRRREIVEITAGRGLNVPSRRKAPSQALPSAYAKSAPPQPAPRAPSPAGNVLETLPAQNIIMRGLTQEMGCLKTMVQDLVQHARRQQCPDIPSELLEYYTQLIQNEVAEELAAEIIKSLQKQMRPEQMLRPELVRERLAEHIERMLPSAGPIVRTKTVGPHVVALIGPTGVGKTTTIAKLAANLKLREKHRVGLITIDTYRIAAVDQLRKYADIIGSPLRVVGTAEDLKDAVHSMGDCDFVLIDTAGRSPNDTMKLNELKTFLTAVNPDEVHLVLSTTASQECVELAISRFSDVRVDKIIFTKLDEAVHVGVVLNVVRKVKKSLSYVTTGQDVPDDIEVGRGRRVAQLILGSGPESTPPAGSRSM